MRALSTPLLAALIAAAVSPALAAPAPAHPAGVAAPKAAATGITADVQCLMSMIAIGQDKTRAEAGRMGAYFFLGRINARAPGFDLPAAMKAEAPKMDGPAIQANLKRCGPMIASGSKSLQAAVNGLRPPGAPAPAQPSAIAPMPLPTVPAPAPLAPAPK
jgi:hypothetical protein